MPQELHVGHRSTLVSSLAWLLMLMAVGGIAGLGLLAWRSDYVRTALDTLVLSLPACGALLVLAIGLALLRRYEWGRKLALGLLVLMIPLLPTLSGLMGGWWHLALAVGVSAVLVWPLRALARPSVKREFA